MYFSVLPRILKPHRFTLNESNKRWAYRSELEETHIKERLNVSLVVQEVTRPRLIDFKQCLGLDVPPDSAEKRFCGFE